MIQRYGPTTRCIGSGEYVADMEKLDDGDFVDYADYEALRLKLARVTEVLEGFCYAASMRYGVSDGNDQSAYEDAEKRHGHALAWRYLGARKLLRDEAAKDPAP